MPTRVADPASPTLRPRPRLRSVPALLGLLTLVLGPVLAGCAGEPSADRPEPAPGPSPTASAPPAPVDVARAVGRLLERRGAAVEGADAEAFLAGVTRDAEELAVQQEWFDTLALLPVGLAEYRLVRESLVLRPDGSYTGLVDLHLQLDGFDPAPTLTRYRMWFEPAGRGFRVVTTRAGAGAQPWDLGPVLVRRDADVIAVLDVTSIGAAADLVPALRRALVDVRAHLPLVPPVGVVVHATGDPSYLASLRDVPGDPDRIDALAVELPAADGGGPTTSRIVLDPAIIRRTGPARDRLLRHEVTHVATAPLVRDVPRWLSEGLAEYVSVRPMRPQDRGISRQAIEAAEDGLASLPADEDFNGVRSDANYGIAWWACEYVARARSEQALWDLVRSWSAAEPGADVLGEQLGLTEEQLARRTARLIEAQYGRPEPVPPPTPTGSPTPSGSPTSTASPAGEPAPDPRPGPDASPTESPSDD